MILLYCLRALIFLILGWQLSVLHSEAEQYWTEPKSHSEIPKIYQHFSDLFEKSNSAVVNISVVQTNTTPFIPMGVTQKPKRSLGTGLIIRADGYILTNDHVIENENGIAVTLANGQQHLAKLIGKDPLTDLALLKINTAEPLPVLVFGNSEELKVGHWVLAIGNPFGFHNTMTHGIVSAMGRVISNDLNRKRFDDFIQIDASINPGNSGGPLLNMLGEVIGINTAMTVSGTGIAFAIPIQLVKKVLPELYRKGFVSRGWIGVVPRPLTHGDGLEILEVVPDSPAAIAGIRKGDYLLSVDGQKVDTLLQFSNILLNSKPGEKITLELMRKKRRFTKSIRVGHLKNIVTTP